MSFISWLQNLRSVPVPRRGRRNHGRSAAGGLRAATYRPHLEALEDRRLLAFLAPVNYPVGSSPEAVVSGDFNNDGRLDVVSANSGTSNVSVLLGNANGTFQPPQNFATDAGPNSLAVGDLNADGKLDLATANASSVSVLLGNGDGTLQTPANFDIASWWSNANAIDSEAVSMAAGDFNGDGKLDLGVTAYAYLDGGCDEGGCFLYYESSAWVLLGDGTGSFPAYRPSYIGFGRHTSAAVADFNSDGKLDFAVANYNEDLPELYGKVSVLLGRGTGEFDWPTVVRVGDNPVAVAAGDMNGDGKIDLATANYSSSDVSVLLGNGLGSFGAVQNFAVGSRPNSVGLADFNGDGGLDAVTSHADTGTVSELLGNGIGALTYAGAFDAGASPVAVTLGDFNDDGRPDVAAANSGAGTVSVLLNNGTWSPPPPPPPTVRIGDRTVTEGNAGSVTATFTLNLSGISTQIARVAYATSNDTASANNDYQSAIGVVTFFPGETMKNISVLINGDRLAEVNETFFVNLSSPTNATIADGQGVGTILDDEPRITISDVSKAEGRKGTTTLFTFNVTLSTAYDQQVTTSYRTVNGSATTGNNDYIAKSGKLTFNPGETTKSITIAVKGDIQKESNETFYVDLFGLSSNAIFTKQRGTGTILNDD